MDEPWLPEPSPETAPYFEAAAARKLCLQCCDDCGAWAFPYRDRCQRCGGTSMQWREATGKGTLYSHALLHRAYHPRHEDRLPITLAQVDVDEGVRLWTNLIDTDGVDVRAGMRVEVAFESFPDGGVVPVFRIANQ